MKVRSSCLQRHRCVGVRDESAQSHSRPARPSSFSVAEATDERCRLIFEFIRGRGYDNRSEAVRDLIRGRLIREEAAGDKGEQVAVVTLVFDHHARELAARLIDKQHHHHDLVVSSLHVHLGERHCLEVSILRGPGKRVRHLADDILATRGVLHGDVMFTGGEKAFRDLGPGHEHSHSHGH